MQLADAQPSEATKETREVTAVTAIPHTLATSEDDEVHICRGVD